MSLTRQGGGGYYFVYCFLQVLKKENFIVENPSWSIGTLWTLLSVSFSTISLWRTHQNSFLHSIFFDLHISLYAYRVFPFMSTCIKHLLAFYPGTITWNSSQSKLCICTYTIRATVESTFSPNRVLFPLNQSGVSTIFSFSLWTLCI